MAVPSIALAYRRSALMTATKVTAKPPSKEVLRARDDFKDFCTVMGKAPAKHMMEWHTELCTGEDTECLLGVGGPNTAILAPRGSAKSTVLGLFAAWMIGRHANHDDAVDSMVLTIGGLLRRGSLQFCLLYTSPSPRGRTRSRMPSSA